MLERLLLAAALGFCALAAHAQHAETSSAKVAKVTPARGAVQKVLVPGTNYVAVVGRPPATRPDSDPALMEAILAWLSEQFELPRVDAFPQIVMASPAQITTFRFTGRLPEHQKGSAAPSGQSEIVAAYDASSETIYMPTGWTGKSAAELSVLVHELVHHLQHVGALHFECPQAAEELAYAAQERWLGLFGRSLESEFGIDPFTRLVNTRCMN
jgi:hypothetical protein